MKSHIHASLSEAKSALDNLLDNAEALAGIEAAGAAIIAALEAGGRVFSCGNGGSMCDAMHFAEELTGRYRNNRRGMAAIAISDPSHISCVGNDYGYDEIFARYLESHARAGDVLLGLSTSGNSRNIVRAAETARELGVKVIILTGRAGTKLEPLADVYVNTPGGQYADRVQELHIKVLHILIELTERHFFPENY
ncbi:D-sedoheptulose 7-phosphate isomerase [Chromobacterium subtsugae]|uniref:Phosphoheptose isomerase n=1 Tax=Chromobacterium subtsugae TaxID=251747 RepID=A0ABS7FHJ6_9NEIS|nr:MULTISPECIES: D-sedoheptulose 7-phosphate isomerase [Chromobacterium]KUM02288.1 phosphoheptose isomerase [Chromobacterium subtsugae]KZE86243.1 phosphoheptose isomerase [Chromobacterium sp. F49]MBW7568089.1 D-sedoheptulose 7-phosphate isomerase [Chromobacterium subtsugae]MBW8289537.1 D-sedoheptulose 7-phosphate isomerase [Chromobacterium subtsugae]OBU86232.1 phosphoheptose isomerase [Chromobacterium subtsugae]